jgi:hypothetical protein
MRADELDPGRIVRHMREVQSAFADAVVDHLTRRVTGGRTTGATLDERLAIAVTGRCVAAAVFAAMEDWMLRDERSLADLAQVCRDALTALEAGMRDGLIRP